MVPTLTPTQQDARIQHANRCRTERAALLAAVATGRMSVADFLNHGDRVAQRTRVDRLLKAVPGVGKAMSATLLIAAGIPQDRRVAGVGCRQRQRLLDALARAPRVSQRRVA